MSSSINGGIKAIKKENDLYCTTPACYINYRWENPTNNRYYTVYFSKDLFDDWIMIRAWGRKNTSLGRVAYGLYESFEEGKNAVAMISEKREKRGYYPTIA